LFYLWKTLGIALLCIGLNSIMIACYGEALIDLIVSPYSPGELRADSQACLGGSVFNFCIAAQRQGLKAVYLNALSSDSFGRQFAQILQAEGVQLDAPKPCSEPTSIAVVQLDAAGKASYAFHRIGVADTARAAIEIIANWPARITALHTGCLMLVPAQWAQTQALITHAQAQGCLISVDANLRLAICPDLVAYRESVIAACSMAHVVKVSDDDLIALGLLRAEHSTPEAIEAARKLLDRSVQTKLVALTLGAEGACLLTHSAQALLAAPLALKVQDTVGAGDSFMAALLAFLNSEQLLTPSALISGLAQAQLESALSHAVAAASICVQRVGCDPATWDETLTFSSQAVAN
jgi:fructokinase